MRQTDRILGRAERKVMIILLLLLSSALAVYALTAHRSSSTSVSAGAQQTAETPNTSPNPIGAKHAHSDSLITDEHYVGGPTRRGDRVEKFRRYVQLDLNRVDSLTLLRIPGVGPAFAHRILSFRQVLGGYYTVLQLQEVYGVDEDKFLELRPWFVIKTPPHTHQLSTLRADSIPWHPYLSRATQRALHRMVLRHGRRLTWQLLRHEGTFTRDDSIRLSPYFVDAPVGADSTERGA